ncbi:hypothetical protein [Pandoraea sp. NPDC090278]|uniref:hypothetical protein n=1 Tax=Pandoraea sp. NPDC090278 TaxID=3364391 RepID=UPI00383B95D1
MQIDTSQFPFVHLSRQPYDMNWESGLDALLTRQERFVLISRQSPTEHDDAPPGDEKRRFALWLKRNRSELKAWCAGAILVADDASFMRLLGPAVHALAKAFGFPVRIALQTEIDDAARRLLSGH